MLVKNVNLFCTIVFNPCQLDDLTLLLTVILYI